VQKKRPPISLSFFYLGKRREKEKGKDFERCEETKKEKRKKKIISFSLPKSYASFPYIYGRKEGRKKKERKENEALPIFYCCSCK